MRPLLAFVLVLLLGVPAFAAHSDGKGPRSLGGAGVPRGDAWLTIESDRFAQRPTGAQETDARATGERAWNLSTYGTITTEIDVPKTGVAWFDIRARGWHPDDMRNPHMHILIDGEQRAEWDVRGEWLTYPQAIPILAGKHTIGVDNFNNYRANVADRALVVDWLSMTEPTLDGSPRVPASGAIVIDASEIHNSVTGQLERTSDARNGTQWLQWGIGCFAHMVIFDAEGVHDLKARLRGNVWNGVGTHVEVKVDNMKIAEHDVGDAWSDHASRASVTAGPHLVEICYDNDEPGKKRNLWLDDLTIARAGGGAPASPPPWPSAHAGLANHRHVASAIDVTSVASAREAWRYDAAGAVTGTPAYADGVLYFGDHGGWLHAVRAEDGKAVWSVEHGAGIDSSVALDETRVYAGDMDGWISARERKDGALAWRVRADPEEGTHQYGSPVLHEGVLYTGVASEQTLLEYKGPQTFRGSVAAFKVEDGSLLWRTRTQTEEGLGVSVWSTPAIDPKLGLLFVGTGNSYGEPVSPYTDSILALRLADGAIVWSHQATKNDAFNARGGAGPDRDFGASPLLFEANGRELVGEGDKGGAFFALDRATGELVWAARSDHKVEGVAASQLEGFLGSASYHKGTIYAPTTARSMVHAIDAATGATRWATELNPLPKRYGDRMFGASTAAEGVVLQGNAFGSAFALDARTGEILVNLSVGGGVQGGITLAGARFFVPHVGKDLWSGRGGIVAFEVDATYAPPDATPTGAPTPATPPATVVSEPGAIGRAIPGLPLIATLIGAALVARSRARARR